MHRNTNANKKTNSSRVIARLIRFSFSSTFETIPRCSSRSLICATITQVCLRTKTSAQIRQTYQYNLVLPSPKVCVSQFVVILKSHLHVESQIELANEWKFDILITVYWEHTHTHMMKIPLPVQPVPPNHLSYSIKISSHFLYLHMHIDIMRSRWNKNRPKKKLFCCKRNQKMSMKHRQMCTSLKPSNFSSLNQSKH